jgi:indole-3-pyruvate monooxygenase
MDDPAAVILGAGPAGLATAACLRRRGLPFVIIERAAAVGPRWHRHYERLHLHTDRRRSALPYLGFPPGTPRYPSRAQMIAYLEQYARHFRIEPHFGEAAGTVRFRDGAWITTTSAAEYRSPHVVVATGFNAVPNVPTWPGQEAFGGRILHSSQYRSGEGFRGQDALVVGLGNSGGDIAMDLAEHGARVWVAVRGPVRIVPRDILGFPILSIALLLSRLPPRLADALAAPLLRATVGNTERLGLQAPPWGPITQIQRTGRVPLLDTGTLRLIRRGHIRLAGGVRALDGDTVRFEDGSSRRFDALILATGFHPGLGDLLPPQQQPRAQHFDARQRIAEPPGLHFCGFTLSATGMLRDLGIEARRIADRIGGASGTGTHHAG